MKFLKRVGVGTTLYGCCDGYFGPDSCGDKVIEAMGKDWVVVRELDSGKPKFANFAGVPLLTMLNTLGSWVDEGDKPPGS